MSRRLFVAALLIMVTVASCSHMGMLSKKAGLADNITGQWKGTFTGMGDPMDLIFTFAVDGETVTGSMGSDMGDMPLVNGKVTGDNTFTFDIDTGDQLVTNSCTYADDTITMEVEEFNSSMKLTRAK